MKSCDNCKKEGLAILPVLYSVSPLAELTPPLPAGSTLAPSKSIPKLTSHSRYVLRSPRMGFIYVLYPAPLPDTGSRWEVYAIDTDGCTHRYVNPDAVPATSPAGGMPKDCRGGGHYVPAQLIALRHASDGLTVHIAYSRYRWTKAVRGTYETRADVRSARMQSFTVGDAKAGKQTAATAITEGILKSHVLDFKDARDRDPISHTLTVPLIDRSAEAKPVVQKAAEISAKAGGKGYVFGLWDTVGITSELNFQRTMALERLQKENAGTTPDQLRRRVVAEIIDGIQKDAARNPGPWYNRHNTPDRYLKHINQSAWQVALTRSKTFHQIESELDDRSKDYVAWKESAAWKQQQVDDFDAHNDVSSLDLEDMVARSVVGSGVNKNEREGVWYSVLAQAVGSKDNWFYRAIGATSEDFIAYANGNKRWDREYDGVKAAAAIMGEFATDDAKALAKLHATLRKTRAANEATGALVASVSGVLFRLSKEKPQLYAKLVGRVTAALLVRGDLMPKATLVTAPAQWVSQKIQEIAFGQPKPGKAPVKVAPMASNTRYKRHPNSLGKSGMALSQQAQGAVLFDGPAAKLNVQSTAAWIVERIQGGGKLDAGDLAKLRLGQVTVKPNTTVTANPYLIESIERTKMHVDVTLAGAVIFFQAISFRNAVAAFVDAKGGLERFDAGVGMATAVLTGMAARFELLSVLASAKGDVALQADRLRWSARLGGLSGALEGAWFFYKGATELKTNSESGWWTMGTGLSAALMGGATYAGGMASAAAAEAEVGEAVLFMGLGPIGWGALVVVFVAVNLYMAWQSAESDNANLNPVEYWLDNGVFGLRQFVSAGVAEKSPYYDGQSGVVKPFASLREEQIALQRLALVASASLSDFGDPTLIRWTVSAPRYTTNSVIEIEIDATTTSVLSDMGGFFDGVADSTTGKRSTLLQVTLKDGRPVAEQKTPGLSQYAATPVVVRADPTIGSVSVEGTLLLQDPGTKLSLQVKYQPDTALMPELTTQASTSL